MEATIREALVKESRFSNEATISIDRSCPVGNPDAKDNPGPGAYDPKPPEPRVACFDHHDTAEPRKTLHHEASPAPLPRRYLGPRPGTWAPKCEMRIENMKYI